MEGLIWASRLLITVRICNPPGLCRVQGFRVKATRFLGHGTYTHADTRLPLAYEITSVADPKPEIPRPLNHMRNEISP